MFTGLYARIAGIAVVVALIAGGWWYVHRINNDRDALRTENILLNDRLKTQNEAIATFKNEADVRLANAQADLAEAEERASKIQQKSQIIYKTAPSRGTATCENDRASTLDLLNARGQTGTLDLMNGVSK